MQGGSTPGGELSPPNLLEGTCIPDIQQTACSSIPADLRNTSNGLEQSESQSKGGRTASLLFITHVIEMTAMVAATILRIVPRINLSPSSESISDDPETSTSSSFEVTSHILGLQLGILIFPFTIVTSISLAWVLRGQDFSGRYAARLVCWLLHILQSSLVWRYLKIQIAYDPGDLTELGMLRFIQLHIHNLPFLVMHVVITLSFSRTYGLALSLSVVMLLSVTTAIIVSTTALQSSHVLQVAAPSIVQICHPTTVSERSHKLLSATKSRFFMGAITVCILWSRVISMAALFCLHAVWAVGLIIAHWVVAVIWLGFQERIPPTTLGSFKHVLRRGFLGYLLLWDWHIFQEGDAALSLCAHPRMSAIYYTVIASQNIAATCAWYITKRFTNVSALYTAMLASVIICQVVGLLLLTFSYLYFSSAPLLSRLHIKKSSVRTSKKPSLVTPSNKASFSSVTPNDITKVLESTHYGEFSDFVEGTNTVNSSRKDVDTPDQILQEQKLHSPKLITRDPDKKDSKYPLSLSPRLLSKHLHCSVYSYSNDILQTSKSERSSTDNGSFNSRNTNTLPINGSIVPEYEISSRPHGSFSDSFSSLSCGTGSKVVTSTSKGPMGSQLNHPPTVKRLKHLKACQNSCCHGKLREIMTNQCAEVKEEQRDETINETEHLSLASVEKGASPPRVAVVRATQRFRVVCTKCLNAHDPLLTRCKNQSLTGPPSLSYSWGGELGEAGGGSSTDYPSDTEFTTTLDTLSSVSADSHSTYTTWPMGRTHGLAKLLLREKGGHEYVTAWLRHQQVRGTLQQSSSRHVSFQQSPPKRYNGQNRSATKCSRNMKRHGNRSKSRSSSIVQDLETIV